MIEHRDRFHLSRGLRPGRRACRRILAAALAGLLLLFAGGPSAALPFRVHVSIERKHSAKAQTEQLAAQLTQEVQQVQNRFTRSRAALRTVKGPGGKPAYLRHAVADLIDSSERDLDQSLERMRKPELAGLRAWAAEKFGQVRSGLPPLPGKTTAELLAPGPEAVAVVASLGAYPLAASAPAKKPPKAPPKSPKPPKAAPAPPPAPPAPPTISTEQSSGLLDQVGQIMGRLLFLAENKDLTVTFWVGSTPKQHVKFRFWAKATASAYPQKPFVLTTNGKKEHVPRGLFSYSAALTDGPVVKLLPGGAPVPAQLGRPAAAPAGESEELDLVDGTLFFCCRFDDNYCHHVASEKDCRRDRR